MQSFTAITHACMDNKIPKVVCDFPKYLTVISDVDVLKSYKTRTLGMPQNHDITAKGFGKPLTNFWWFVIQLILIYIYMIAPPIMLIKNKKLVFLMYFDKLVLHIKHTG